MITEQSQLKYLKIEDLEEMHKTFLMAFSDYQIPFNLSLAEFSKKFVEKLNMDFSLSPAVFDEDRMVAFIFTSLNIYDGLLTAYNGGTGVIKSHRGIGLVKQMYNFLTPKLKEKNVTQCVLEVLTQNERAIRAYDSCGFRKSRYYHCYKLTGKKTFTQYNYPWGIKVSLFPEWKTYTKFFDFLPSFLDTPSMIDHNLKNERIIEAVLNGEVVGYAIYQPIQGRISHIGVNPGWRRKGIGSSLLNYIYEDSANKNLSIININKEASGMKEFLSVMGFENQFDQWEMVKRI